MKGFINFVREQGVVGLAVGFILGGERLRFAGRDRGIAFDQLGEDPAECLNAEGQRRHIE